MITSPTPSRSTSPMIVQTMVPGDFSVPSVRNHAAPREMMRGTLASVSMLSTSVGGASASPPGSAISTCEDRLLRERTSPYVSTSSRSPRRYGGAIRGNG